MNKYMLHIEPGGYEVGHRGDEQLDYVDCYARYRSTL